MKNYTQIPFEFCKDLLVKSDILNGFFAVPLSTFELTLFKSLKRGALLSRKCDGISVFTSEHVMTRSILIKSSSLEKAFLFKEKIEAKNSLENSLKQEVKEKKIIKSNYCKLIDFYTEIVGNLIFIRFNFETGQASGHNMTTKASDELIKFIFEKYQAIFDLEYVSVSGNICTDKKNSAINGILSRGRRVYAEITISEKMCEKILKTTPKKIYNLNYYKNFIGSCLAASVRSANSHFANIIAAFYLSTGQDVANVVEGSQGFTFCEILEDNSLKFSINCPNIIMGSIGNGKGYDFIKKNITGIFTNGNLEKNDFNIEKEENLSKKLSIILGSAILCGEIALMASLTNYGDLVSAHMKYERV